MIVLNVLCQEGHAFEGWFASTDAFRSQCARMLVNCPQCHTPHVKLMPSAPHVKRGAPERSAADVPAAAPPRQASEVPPAMMQAYQALLLAAKKAENVGERFPEEARRIHYQEAPARTIRGVASASETLALIDEGITVLPAPIPGDDEMH